MSANRLLRLFVPVRQSLSLCARRYASAEAASAPAMPFTLASPGAVYYNNSGDVRQADVPTQTGVVGVLPYHVPLLAALKPGVVTVFETDGDVEKYFVSSGQLTINKDGAVQILAEEMCKLDEIDSGVAKSELSTAQSEMGSATDDLSRAEAQIKVEVLEAIIRAADQGQ